MAASILSFENEVFSKFAFYSTVVLLKTVVMSLWTSRHRLSKQVFVTQEDYKLVGKSVVSTTTDPDVERVRSVWLSPRFMVCCCTHHFAVCTAIHQTWAWCHQNDLENVLPFVLIGVFYVLTGPDLYTATLHFQLFAGFRLLHTLFYLNAVRQPFRAIAFAVNFGVNISMLISILMKAKY